MLDLHFIFYREIQNWMFQLRLDLWLLHTLSTPTFFNILTYYESLTTSEPSNSGKSSCGQLTSWLKSKPSSFVSSRAKNSPLKYFPLILAEICLHCTKPWYGYSNLTRRRNENKRSLKTMNHVCHHQRGGWCGILLGSHKPLGVMEEVRADLYCAYVHRCSRAHTATLKNTHLPHIFSFNKTLSVFFFKRRHLKWPNSIHALEQLYYCETDFQLTRTKTNATCIV